MGFLSSLGNIVSKGLDYISAPLSQPLTFITQGPTAAAKAVETSRANIAARKESGVAKIATIVASTAVVGGAVLAAAPTASSGALGVAARTVVKAVTPTTVKGAVGLAVAAPIVYGVVKSNPEGAQNAIAAAPGNLANFGQNVGDLVNNPSLETLKETFKENPVISTVVAGAGVAAIGGGIGLAANSVATYLNSKATKANTAATLGGDGTLPSNDTSSGGSVLTTNTAVPTTAATGSIKTGTGLTSTKRKKKRSKAAAKPQNIFQRVNITFDNDKIDNKKYLKGASIRR